MKASIKTNKLFLVIVAVTGLNFSLLESVEASTLVGKFPFEGYSTYCEGREFGDAQPPDDAKKIMMMASLMLTKQKNAEGKEILVPEKSTVQFSLTKEEAMKNCKNFNGSWESRPMKVTNAEFDDQWNLKSFKFLDFAEKKFDSKKYEDEKKKFQDFIDNGGQSANYRPTVSYHNYAYMTGFFDFMMTQKGITFYLLDYNFNQFGGSPPPMTTKNSDARKSLDSGDFNRGTRPGNPSDTTTIMDLPNIVQLKHVPEPTSILSFLALGTLGAASTLKRKPREKEREEVS